jgi:spore coat protein CotH
MKKILTLILFACLSFSLLRAQGETFFAEGTVHEIRFQFDQPGFWDSLVANKPEEIYMRCDVTIDGALYPDAGVRFKGNSSYNNPSQKKPFKIDLEEFIEDQTHDGLKQLSLNNGFKDPTFLREKLMLDFCRQHGIASPRATFANLYLNGELWGLYSVIEDVGKSFLSQTYGNNDGNLYKGDPRGSLTWKGDSQAIYEMDYELKTNELENDWSDFITFLDVLNNTPSAQLPDVLPGYLHLESWFDYWAVHNLFVNLDSYIGSGHNYYLYQNEGDDRFRFITWDVNEAFGNFKMGLNLQQIKNLPFDHIPQPFDQRPMMNRLRPIAAFRQMLADRLCELLPGFTNEKMDARIDSLADLLRPHVQADSKKFYSNTQFEQNLSQDLSTPGPQGSFEIAGLKSFIEARHAALMQQLTGLGCTETASKEWKEEAGITVFPNPAATAFFVKTTKARWELSLWNANGQRLKQLYVDGTEGTLRLDGVLPGMYFLKITFLDGSAWMGKAAVTE